jgi:hypothetical protein
MKFERNVKANERRTIVQHIQYRKYAIGKESRHVQVRGHRITAEKLSRWMRETVVNHPPLLKCPLSRELMSNAPLIILHAILIIIAIPSGISIRTNSSPGSPTVISYTISEYQQPGIRSISQSDMTSAVIQRLFAHVTKHVIESQEAGAVFNDLQLILGCKPLKTKKPKNLTDELSYQWNPAVKEDVTRLQNSMNVPRKIAVGRESNGRQQHNSPFNFIY